MSNQVNNITFAGYLGADAELRYTSNATPVVNFNVANTRGYKDASGEWQQRTNWMKVVGFGKLYEAINQYLVKGKFVTVIGEIEQSEYTDKEGNKRTSYSIRANEVILGNNSPNSDEAPVRDAKKFAAKAKAASKPVAKRKPAPPVEEEYEEEYEDDEAYEDDNYSDKPW